MGPRTRLVARVKEIADANARGGAQPQQPQQQPQQGQADSTSDSSERPGSQPGGSKKREAAAAPATVASTGNAAGMPRTKSELFPEGFGQQQPVTPKSAAAP